MKKTVFSTHAEDKFLILKRHGFVVSKRKVLETLKNPDKVEPGYKGRKVAQKIIDETHVLRVVFEEMSDKMRVITFYPGRRDRYED